MYSLWQDLSHGTISFDLVTLTLKFDLLLKNFNYGFYLVMVAARRASLSSDNSYFVFGNERTLVACKSLRSALRFTRFTRDQCPFISQCKQKSVLQSLNSVKLVWWFIPPDKDYRLLYQYCLRDTQYKLLCCNVLNCQHISLSTPKHNGIGHKFLQLRLSSS